MGAEKLWHMSGRDWVYIAPNGDTWKIHTLRVPQKAFCISYNGQVVVTEEGDNRFFLTMDQASAHVREAVEAVAARGRKEGAPRTREPALFENLERRCTTPPQGIPAVLMPSGSSCSGELA